jgi:hypothetical protein
LKYIYETYIPNILKNNNQIKYNLSEENIFGNLNYSMSQDLLKGKNVKINYDKLFNFPGNNFLIKLKPSKLMPIIRIKSS